MPIQSTVIPLPRIVLCQQGKLSMDVRAKASSSKDLIAVAVNLDEHTLLPERMYVRHVVQTTVMQKTNMQQYPHCKHG